MKSSVEELVSFRLISAFLSFKKGSKRVDKKPFRNRHGLGRDGLDIKFTPTVLAECKVQNESLASAIKSITKERVRLENGADASLMRMTGEHASQCPGKGQNGKYPMLTLIHGGPFGASPLDMLLIMRTFFILQGYCLLIVNYRGSTGYGKDFLDSLLGHIGSRDVEDCGDLTLKAV